MPACLRVAWLAGGGCASGVFGEPLWQPCGGIGQFRWQRRGGIVQFRWQHRGGTVQFRWQHRGGSCWPCRATGPIGGVGECWSGLAWMLPALLATAWLIWCLAWPADWACYFAVVGIMGGVTVGWCASRGTLMPSFATVLIAALSAGSTLSRPVPWSVVLLGVQVSFLVVEAIYAEGSMGRPLWPGHAFGSARGLLVVAKGAPLPVLGALGVRDPGVRAGTLARACGFLFRGRSLPPGSVSGHPGGAGRYRGRLPGS
ncbi:hypothetical protein V6N12_020296 [Hibiscus sabdariffa]|uniref:Uncharacterized protein n=1 Tax=Hibiscus sabdariffa TaxID=183260 RepID=A0ABR2BUE4_9ROSI